MTAIDVVAVAAPVYAALLAWSAHTPRPHHTHHRAQKGRTR